MKNRVRPIKKWTTAKVKVIVQASMALGAMVGVSQNITFWEIRLPNAPRSPIFLVYSEDFLHGVSSLDGVISHHTGISKDDIADGYSALAEQGAIE